jgi:large subunit ribosomal protein L25
MPDRVTIAAQPRTIVGKHLQHLRRDGLLPANVYGRGLESRALQVDAREFVRTIRHSGSRALFDLAVEDEPSPRPVVVRQIMRKGGMGEPLHVDFFQVDPRRPIISTVSVRLTGEAPAVRDLAGTLTHTVDSLQVRCYPLAIPEALEADLGKLVSFDVSLTVADLTVPDGVDVLVDPSVVIATVLPPRIRSATAETETEPD